jgi:hypothetical protein
MNSDPMLAGQVGRARDAFAIAYLKWALQDAKKQSASGFPLLALLRDGLAREYVRFWAALSEERRDIFVSGMVKRFHKRAMELTGMTMSPEENRLIEQHLNSPRKSNNPQLEEDFYRPRPTRQDLRKLKVIVKRFVDQETGGACELWAPGHVVFHRTVGQWRVSTSITVHTKIYLSYDHSIHDCQATALKEHISVTNWLGIGGQTTWMLMRPDELEASAQSALVIANYFLDAVPGILADISLY